MTHMRITPPAPLHTAQPVTSLLSSADTMPNAEWYYDDADNLQTRPSPHWMNGVQYAPELCSGGGTIPVSCAVTQSAWADNTPRDLVKRDAFLVWAGDQCDASGFLSRDYVGRAQRLLTAQEAIFVEREVWDGAAAITAHASDADYSTNQYLAQDPTTPGASVVLLNSGTAYTKLIDGLAAMTAALASCAGGGPGMIHAPTQLSPDLVKDLQVKVVGGKLVDVHGNVYVLGGGYSGNGPRTGGTAGVGSTVNTPPSGKVWIYGTSLMRYWREDTITITPDTYAQALEAASASAFGNSNAGLRTPNHIRFYAQRAYLVDWDPCCHFAALVPISGADD